MSEELKLIKALCDALGFEVVNTKETKERKVNNGEQSRYVSNIDYPDLRGWELKTCQAARGPFDQGRFDIDKNGMYTAQKHTYGYKLIKKGDK
jgi:hypothetical protein